jgi:hypothetical protein
MTKKQAGTVPSNKNAFGSALDLYPYTCDNIMLSSKNSGTEVTSLLRVLSPSRSPQEEGACMQ